MSTYTDRHTRSIVEWEHHNLQRVQGRVVMLARYSDDSYGCFLAEQTDTFTGYVEIGHGPTPELAHADAVYYYYLR